ncbi:MAG: hypothetical protein QOG72_791 [Sphingomonadales bacterium]|nr:hypothetical protein [Sphingomonadales bacterium]
MVATIEASGEEIDGRAAANRLADYWDDRDWVPLNPSLDWARAAIGRLGEMIAAQPSMFRASMRGAGKGASTLSPRPFQGLVECLQNADDLGAASLRIAYRTSPRPELLIVHDGSPVTLANVGAMLLPWLSTKDDDPEASGRFGIGQRTITSLGGPIEMHAPPFHFIMGDDGPEPCEAEADVENVYDAALRHTMLVIPLLTAVSGEAVAAAVRALDVHSLIFLKSIRRVQFINLEDPAQNLNFAIAVTPSGSGEIDFDGETAAVDIAEVRVLAPANETDVTFYQRYSTRRSVGPHETRSNKATGSSTPIGICVPLATPRPMPLYDRMPLPVETGLSIGLNAQFDPDSARSTLQPNDWNIARFADLERLVTWAALEAFSQRSASSWGHVPLEAEALDGDGWTQDRVRTLVANCQDDLREQLLVGTGSGPRALADLAYEHEELEALLTEADIERLRPSGVAMPRSGRDPQGRWRRVLDELGQCQVVEVADALQVIDGQGERVPEWYVSFAALAERHGLTLEFSARPSILLDDGAATARPQLGESWVLVRRSSPDALATRLGLARRIHSSYLDPEAPTTAFLSKLEKLGVLFDNRDAGEDVFAVLARGPATGAELKASVRLEDDDLVALRDAWAQLPRDQHAALGPKIGRSIELKAMWYDADGKRVTGWARPIETYLPAAIDREVDSFAKAAGRARGLKWVDPEYARLLKQQAGRSAIGAQRLLVAWGVAREPRLLKPANERVFWARDTTPASPIGPMQTAEQLQGIRAGAWNTHLIDDHWSPDADTVAADIAKAAVKLRRKRAVALLATLSRGWERRYSEAATATPAYAYNGYWHRSTEIRATWLARLADVKWMPDAASGLQRPADLQLQVPGSPPRTGERPTTVAKFDSQILRSGILAALGVKAGPTQRDLVARLQSLRKQTVSASVIEDASAIYQLLAASLRDKSEAVPEGRMTQAQLRNAFRGSVDGPGLLLVGRNWNSPEQVFRGPALFGERRAFAPHIEGLEPLWKVLGVRLPTAADAIGVLKEMALGQPSSADLGIAIRAYTLISAEVGEMSSQLRTTLKRLPLWTGSTWATERPFYALEGEALLASAPPQMRVWRTGITSFSSVEALLEPLGVVRLTPSDFEPASTAAYGLAEGEQLRPSFAGAVSLLRQELVRADQVLLDSLSIDWDELLAAPVVIDPQLSIVATLSSGQVVLPARAHMGREPLRLIVRSAADLATAEGAGAAVGSLFAGDRQKAAWAWASIWPRAAAGEQAVGAVMPKTRADRGGGKERLERLAKQAAQRTKPKNRTKKSTVQQHLGKQAIQVRKLRELEDLDPSVGEIVNEGAKPVGGMVFAKRRPAKPRVFTKGGGKPEQSGAAQVRTVLPPSSDRERMALDAVRCALRLDVKQLNDLRAARGVGVDAIDELRQCYEIKMSSGAGIPNDVTLTASEVEAARDDENFFLAIVSGLEEGAGQLRVRFIFDPLTNLDVRVRGDLILTGVEKAEALEFRFDRRPTERGSDESPR